MSKTLKYLMFFVAGQATILFLLWLSLNNNLYSYRLVPFCTVCGIIIDLCIVFGAMLNDVPNEESPKEKHNKSYMDYVRENTDEEDNLDEVIRTIYEVKD